MESVRRQMAMELVPFEQRMQKVINHPTFKHCTVYITKICQQAHCITKLSNSINLYISVL